MKNQMIDTKSVGNTACAMDIIVALLNLKHLIETACEVYDTNGEAIEELHRARTDIEHLMVDETDDDPAALALTQHQMLQEYRNVQWRRRELLTEDAALENVVYDEDFYKRVCDICDTMAGQLQYINHARYTPKSSLTTGLNWEDQ